MARPPLFTDVQLRTLIHQGYRQEEIAEHFGVSASAISQRMKDLDANGGTKLKVVMPGAAMSLEQTRAIILDNYFHVAAMLENESLSTLDRLRVMREMRQQLAFGIEATYQLYSIEQTREFLHSVHESIDAVDPAIRPLVLAKWKEKRPPLPPKPKGAVAGANTVEEEEPVAC
jgi:transposase